MDLTQPPRLLVVGGGGFIGRHVVQHALGLGWHVTSVAIGARRDGGTAAEDVRYLTADVTNAAALTDALGPADFEYVVNCGGYIDHTPFSRGGRRVLDAHFAGVLNLVEIVNRNCLRAFVNIGSSDEYGDAPAPQVESAREAPISPYSAGKAAATHVLQMLFRTEGLPATTLRLFLTYGPGQDERRFVPQVIRGCLGRESFPASRGEQLRDFCFVQDTVEAVFAACLTPAARGEVINVASGQPVTIRHVVETIQRLVGGGCAEFGRIAYRPGENMALYADIAKARSLLGWEPRVSLAEGLAITAQRIIDHV